MRNIIRFYHQNRKSIWVFLLIIFFLFLMLKFVDYLVGVSSEKEKEEQTATTQNQEELSQKDSNVQLSSNKSAVSGQTVRTENLKNAKEVIEEFFNNCSRKNYEEAYQSLTDECKEEMYPSLEIFINTYASKIFNGQEISCSMENWTGDTYKVGIQGDILATGKINEEETLQDYITVKDTADGYKLNINNYVGRSSIEKSKEKDHIKIEVLQKDMYMDYEKYTIKVENNSTSDILLDTKRDMESIYIEDQNEVHYSAYTQELTDTDLTIYRNNTRTITIKYYSSYITNKKIEKLVFSNVIMDYDANTKTTANKKIEEIKVNI